MTIQSSDEAGERELRELVACTLNDTDLKSQRERWLNLGENFGISRYETADGLRLTFTDHPAVAAELQALVDVESDCCNWAAWSVEREDGQLLMSARSHGDGIATLHGMFTSAFPPPTTPHGSAASSSTSPGAPCSSKSR